MIMNSLTTTQVHTDGINSLGAAELDKSVRRKPAGFWQQVANLSPYVCNVSCHQGKKVSA